MAQKSKSNKPSHSVFHVRGEGKSAFWTKIGAAWMHDDQGGLNLQLDLVPVGTDGRLVIRCRKDDEEANHA